MQPRASTALPHTQVCGLQALEPNLWATATLMALSDSLSPTAVMVVYVASHQSVQRPQQEVWLYPRQMEPWKGLGSCDLLQLVHPRFLDVLCLLRGLW